MVSSPVELHRQIDMELIPIPARLPFSVRSSLVHELAILRQGWTSATSQTTVRWASLVIPVSLLMPYAVIATSGPSSVWPKKAYRNPTDQLVKFLDYKHQADWSIFEFRAEGTGYPDSEVYNRIHHFPWPDHHPPPFATIPALMASMRNWIQGESPHPTKDEGSRKEPKRRVAVLHCKAGKGRSGTAACSYLISEEGWKKADALQRFTDRRMRVGFGNGVSIPSQLRCVGYVDRWANHMSKCYVERPVEIVELHVWGLRDGVRVTVEGYVENGRRIQTFHIFRKDEKIVVNDGKFPVEGPNLFELNSPASKSSPRRDGSSLVTSPTSPTSSSSDFNLPNGQTHAPSTGSTVLLKPSSPIILPTSDINIDFERRNKAALTGWTMVTAVAHVWFNAYFEGGHEGNDSGVFEIEWEVMDGIKGSARKGSKALDRLKVVWRYPSKDNPSLQPLEQVITEPARGEPVPEPEPADWRGDGDVALAAKASRLSGVNNGRPGGAVLAMGASVAAGAEAVGKDIGLRKDHLTSAEISRANSVGGTAQELSLRKGNELAKDEIEVEDEDIAGIRPHVPDEEETTAGKEAESATEEQREKRSDTRIGRAVESGVQTLGSVIPGRTKTTNSQNEHRKERSS